MGRSLGSLLYYIKGKNRNFKRKMDENKRKVRDFESRTNKAKKALRNFKRVSLATVGAVTAITGAVAAAVKKTAEYADEIDKTSQRIGLSAEETQRWKFVSEQMGASLETISTSLTRLQRRMNRAQDEGNRYAEALDQIGVKATDADGNLRDMEDLFPDIIKSLSDMENETQRNAIAMDLFGRSGDRLIPILNQSSDEIEDLMEKAEEMDIVMPEEDIKTWVEFKDEMHAIKEQAAGAFRNLSTGLLPFLKYDLVPFLEKKAIPAVQDFADGLKWFFDTSFSWEGGEDIYQKIQNVESIEEAQKMLEKWKNQYEEYRAIIEKDLEGELKGEGPLGSYSKEQLEMILEANKKAKQARDVIEALERKIKELEETQLGESAGSGENSTSEEKPPWIGDGPEGPEVDEEKQKQIAQRVMDLGYEKAIIQMEGLQKELMQIRQAEKKELRGVEDPTLRTAIKEKFQAKRVQIIEDYAKRREERKEREAERIAEIEQKLTDRIKQINENEYKYKKWKLEQEKQKYLDAGADKEKVEKWYNAQVKRLNKERKQDKMQTEEKIKDFKYKYNKISLEEYREFLKERLNQYDKYSKEWLAIYRKLQNLPEPDKDKEDARSALGMEAYRKGQIQFGQMARDLKNPMVSMFHDIGYSIEEAKQNFENFKGSLVDGLTQAIVRGENLTDTLKNIADQIASMVVKESIVKPAVDFILSGMATGHSGGLVTTAGIIPEMHDGGLANDEIIAKLQTGERVLSREENKKYEKKKQSPMQNRDIVVLKATDAKSFADRLRQHGKDIVDVAGRDILENGALRDIIKELSR